MTSKLNALMANLIAAESALILQAAEISAIPSDKTLRKIADLEVAIGAVEAVIEDEGDEAVRT